MTLKRTLPILLSLFSLYSFAQDNEPKLKLAPTGRVLIDGALYASPQKENFPDGMAISEARLGAKMSYGKWSALMDVAYSYAKIGLRNMWIQYDFNEHNSVRFGNFIQPYGLMSTTSNSLKATYEQPIAGACFTPGIQLGVMYGFKNKSFWCGASFHVESSALSNAINAPLFNQQGYSILSRLVWRKAKDGGSILQAGINGGFCTPQRRVEGNEDIHDGFTISANYPTKVAQRQAVGATITDSRNMFKLSPELLVSLGRVALEAEYYFEQVNRKNNLHSYVSHGAFATLRGVIIGENYSYDATTAYVKAPKPGSLECVVNYNYAKLSDSAANIFGGRANSVNVTFNYYFNPYITARLNYTYTHAWDHTGFDPTSLNGFQARLMVLF